jgi:hypothetical protein
MVPNPVETAAGARSTRDTKKSKSHAPALSIYISRNRAGPTWTKQNKARRERDEAIGTKKLTDLASN